MLCLSNYFTVNGTCIIVRILAVIYNHSNIVNFLVRGFIGYYSYENNLQKCDKLVIENSQVVKYVPEKAVFKYLCVRMCCPFSLKSCFNHEFSKRDSSDHNLKSPYNNRVQWSLFLFTMLSP